MIPLIDSHHHIWRQDDLPWLKGPMVPRIFGPYEAIRRDYPIEEYLADIAASGVEKSVYVQTNWPREKAVEEVAYVQSIADSHGWPHGIVGYTDLLSDDAPEILAALAKFPLMRGIRMQLHWHDNPLYRFAATPDIMDQPAFRKNFSRLVEHGLTFDLQVFTSQMVDAAKLAAAFPETTFILQHAGMLEDKSPSGWAAWMQGMRQLADQPNIVTKFSGLGTFLHRNDASHIREITGHTLEIFGISRCLFGSNFPIEKLWTSYADLVVAHRLALGQLPDAAQSAILNYNAARIYKL
jgi:predicted TIM-barrel fold metal-dependent hydrolase